VLELAVQIGAGAGLARPIKDFVGRSVFHQFTYIHEHNVICQAPGLTEDMGDQHNGVGLLELEQVFSRD
jgi:hypothetical protein